MKPTFLILFSSLILFVFASDNCVDEFVSRSLKHPSECCKHPRLDDHFFDLVDKCTDGCNVTGDPCCHYDCFFSALKLNVDKKFQKENFIELVLYSADDQYKSEWKEVMEQNVDKCEKLSKFFFNFLDNFA